MKVGRPEKFIDWSQVQKLCGIQCTEDEISQFTGVSVDVLHRACKRVHGMNFADFFKQNRGQGKVSLRRYQWQAAQKGNPTMLIWLGKQFLQQSDKNTHEISGPGGKPIEVKNKTTELTDEQLDAEIQKRMKKALPENNA